MNEYPLFQMWYKNLNWILDKCERFPKNVRYSYASKIAQISISITELLVEIIYSKERIDFLKKLNVEFEKLRIFFRLGFDRHYITSRQNEYIQGQINEMGKMTGGWLKNA